MSLVEIGNAMAVVAEQAGGMDAAELKREALALFGGRRLTQAIAARLDAGLQHGIARGLLDKSDSGRIKSTSH